MLHQSHTAENLNLTKCALIILPRQIGDVLVSTALPSVIKQHSEIAVTIWLAHPMCKQILSSVPGLDHVWYHPVAPKWRGKTFQFLKDCLSYTEQEIKFCSSLRKIKLFAIIDIFSTPHSALWTFLIRAQIKIGLQKRWVRNFAYTHLVPLEKLKKGYVGANRLHFLEPLGIPYLVENSAIRMQVNLLPSILNHADNLILEWRKVSKTRGFLLFSITSRKENRKWSLENYVNLAAKILLAYEDISIVWLWGPGEEAEVFQAHRLLRQKIPNSAMRSIFPPLLRLLEVSAVASKSLGFVGNTNGLCHISIAGGAKTIQIHGPSVTYQWTFPDSTRHKAIQRREGCVACDKSSCEIKTLECLTKLDVPAVFAEIQNHLLLGLNSRKKDT